MTGIFHGAVSEIRSLSVAEASRSAFPLFILLVRVVEAEHAPTEVKMLVLHVLDGACTVSTVFCLFRPLTEGILCYATHCLLR